MIKTLRRKFILITMSLIFVILLMVFAAVCWTNYSNLQSEGQKALSQAILHQKDDFKDITEIGGPKKEINPFSFIPVFTVLVNSDGVIISQSEDTGVSMTNEVLSKAVSSAFNSSDSEGVLSKLNLRFLKENSFDGVRIAFADTSYENASMNKLFLNSLIIGFFSLTAFFVITMFLSRWVLRPAEKAWKQQQQFVADASHELKTPLTVILANSSILLTHKEDKIENQVKWIESTKDVANQMKVLVDDMLFLARSDAAPAKKIYTKINFSDIVTGNILQFESVAFENKLTINSDICPDIYIMGDEGQMKQVISILIDNACKYSTEGSFITVTLRKVQNRVHFTVNNTGAIIPREDIPHVFERFYRVDKARERKQGSYGLGLAIAKSIIDNHEGKISVESSETVVSSVTFKIQLPCM